MAKEKPAKPYPDFPLYAHRNGQWAKRINKEIRYFGKWEDWKAAIDKYERQREALYAGREPEEPGDTLSVEDACNAFLEAKEVLLLAGELSQRTFDDYKATCERIVKQFGRKRSVESLVPADFNDLRKSLAKRFGPVRLSNEITWVRMVFRYVGPSIDGHPTANLLERPVNFGPVFRKPSKRVMRIHREESGEKLFAPAEIQTLLDLAIEPMRTIILLGINCALGNTDIGQLELRHLDLDNRWLNFPRPKTGIKRRIRLWPETVDALHNVLKERENKRQRKRKVPWTDPHPELVFLTKYGQPWHNGTADNPTTREMSKLLHKANLRRPGLSYYALRHTFQTIGEESGDVVAVRAIMGHAPDSGDMGSVYRERMSDERLIRVAHHVHQWLYSSEKAGVQAS